MKCLLVALLLALQFPRPGAPAGGEPIDGIVIPLPAPAGWVMLPDGVTLIVSQPETGELVYFDTVAEQESKRVAVDFKPAAMALQGDTLYVAAKGAALVYALDAKTGKQKKEIPLEGDAVANLACHPTKGLVYASTTTLKVYAIDPATGKGTKTAATGNFLVVDPVNGTSVFTGVQPPRDEEEILIKDLPGGRIKVYWDRWGTRAFVLKYTVAGKDLKLVSSQKNAAVNAYTLAITPDGRKVMMTSGGGWRPPVEGGTGGDYVCAAFSTENLETMVGQAPAATNMALHPVLNLGVLNQQGLQIQLFNPRSLIGGKTYTVAKGADARPLLVTFGGKGTKVVLWNGDNPRNPEEGLHFLPLPLTAEDWAALEKAYGKLPTAVAVKPEATPTPGKKPTPGKTPPGELQEPVGLPPGVIATAGFNDAKGLNSNAAPNSPYPLGKNNALGGIGERGWRGLWPADSKAMFDKDSPGEGDGSLKLTGTINYNRTWTKPQTGSFVVELMARAPAGSGGGCYVWDNGDMSTGPMWRVGGGKFYALDGNGGGGGNWTEVAACEADMWYKVRLAIDVKKQTFTFAVGDGPAKPFKFRYSPSSLQTINFLVEGDRNELHIDAIRVLEAKK